MILRHGPHDGEAAPGPAKGQIGYLTSLRPGCFTLEVGEPAAVYVICAGEWRFWKYIPRGCGREVWEALMFGRRAMA